MLPPPAATLRSQSPDSFQKKERRKARKKKLSTTLPSSHSVHVHGETGGAQFLGNDVFGRQAHAERVCRPSGITDTGRMIVTMAMASGLKSSILSFPLKESSPVHLGLLGKPYSLEVKNPGFGVIHSWAEAWVLPPFSCVAVGRCLRFLI